MVGMGCRYIDGREDQKEWSVARAAACMGSRLYENGGI